MSEEVSTAKKGDPGNASRGAAVGRAKLDLADALDEFSFYDRERVELGLLAGIIGCDAADARARLDKATLAEVAAWAAAVRQATPARKVVNPFSHLDG